MMVRHLILCSFMVAMTMTAIASPKNNIINILIMDKDDQGSYSSQQALAGLLEYINKTRPNLNVTSDCENTTTPTTPTPTKSTPTTTVTVVPTTPAQTMPTTIQTTPTQTMPTTIQTTPTQTTPTTIQTTPTQTMPTTIPTTPPPPPCVDFTIATYDSFLQVWQCKCIVGYAGDPFVECGPDTDLDGWPNDTLSCSTTFCIADNCPYVPNSGQEDCDNDGVGDACQSSILHCTDPCHPSSFNASLCVNDADLDGISDANDNCPFSFNPTQSDQDSDTVGDECDNCISVSNINQEDQNSNFVGDVCDSTDATDTDGDGIPDAIDNCINDSNHNQLDSDNDGDGDVCDSDVDNDGVSDNVDNCRLCFNPTQTDSDNNGIGDVCENGDFDCDCINPPCELDPCHENNEISGVSFNKFITVALDPITSGQSDPNWVINDGGKEIVQTYNSDPGLAIGTHSFNGVDYEGTVFVNTDSDDDFIGFIFGYKDNSNFYVVAWKKYSQSAFWVPVIGGPVSASPRVSLKAITSSTGPGPYLKDALWSDDSVLGESTVLYSSSSMGWTSFTSYRWELSHRPDQGLISFKIFEGANLIVDSGLITDHTHKGGRLGVYCFSQEDIHWSKLSYKCNDDDLTTKTSIVKGADSYFTIKDPLNLAPQKRVSFEPGV